jgi:hypothetical protein
MRWKCLCDVYVNSLGDICIRQFGRAPLPPGETVFGTTDWLDSYDRDRDGYPVFQGVRGARVKIPSSSPPAEMSSSSVMRDAFRNTTRSLQRLFISGTDQPLSTVMSRRQELYAIGVQLDREYEIFTLRMRQLEILEIAFKKNLELINTHTAHLMESENISGSPSDVVQIFQKLIADLMEANAKIRMLQEAIEVPSFDLENYRSEKARVQKETKKLSLLLENMSL